MKKILIAATLLFCTASVSATSNIETAKSFVDALDAGKPSEVEALLADDIVFEDPTWGARQSGKANVLKVYAGYTAGAHDLSKLVLDAFESNGIVVLTYAVHATMDLVPNATPDQRTSFMGRMVRVIRFKDGKIVQHTDLADYEKLMREMAQERAARGIKAN